MGLPWVRMAVVGGAGGRWGLRRETGVRWRGGGSAGAPRARAPRGVWGRRGRGAGRAAAGGGGRPPRTPGRRSGRGRWVWSEWRPFARVGCPWARSLCERPWPPRRALGPWVRGGEGGSARGSCRSRRAGRLFPTLGARGAAGSRGGQERPEGLASPGAPAHLPFPWGTVLGALGALLPPAGSSADPGRALVRRPLLGRSRRRGSAFRPLSCRARRVIRTPESCQRKKESGSCFLLPPPKTGKTLPWES